MSATIFPFGLFINNLNVLKRADFFAYFAAYTRVSSIKIFRDKLILCP